MIITRYYKLGDLAHYIADNFFNYSWYDKLLILRSTTSGLKNIYDANIIHKDYHSGNIFHNGVIGDLGLSKSAIEALDDDSEIYGIIPYVAPEVLQGQKYAKASDIYSFGMIMWELMTGRRPFWDKNHDAELIIEICDGVRPPIVTNAPEGYVEIMKECCHSDPNKRPTANDLFKIFGYDGKLYLDKESKNPTKIIKSPDIGPITNNPNAIYKSRPLSAMIKSAESTRSLIIQSKSYFYILIVLFFNKKKIKNKKL
jgi:serine/threonine protein kinase